MKVKEIKGITCPECGEFIRKTDAEDQLKPANLDIRYECGECDELYEDKDEARECCKD